MNIKHKILSTLSSLEAIISPPPMLGMVLATVFNDNAQDSDNQQPKAFNPNITVRMLRAANFISNANQGSSSYGKTGYDSAKSLVLSLSIYNQLVDRGFIEDNQFNKNWQRFLEVANAAQHIVSLFDPRLLEKAYIAGLLHDFGRICLHRYFPEEAALALSFTSNGMDILEAERSVYNTDHQEIGQLIALKWGMPHMLTEVIKDHHPRDENDISHLPTLTKVIVLADNLLSLKQINIETLRKDPLRLKIVEICSKSLGINKKELDQIFSVLPRHLLYDANLESDPSRGLKLLTMMNDQLYDLYIELGKMFKERQELSRRLLEENRAEVTLDSLRMAMATLSHYINNSIMSISGQGEILQQLYEKGDKERAFERIPEMNNAVIKTVKRVSIILDELSQIRDPNKIKYFKDSIAIDIDNEIKARLSNQMVTPKF